VKQKDTAGEEQVIKLKVENLHKTYKAEDRQVPALQGVSLHINEGDVYTLLGPSGCGKTTILRCVAGLEKPDRGEIILDDTVLYSGSTGAAVPPYKRNLGMVFQSYAIWPHMNVFDNVAFPLFHGGRKHSRQDVREHVTRALKMVQLEGMENRSATLLSGGQQQRVALARALVYQPSILLLDEPLSNLDARLRDEVRKELKELVKRLNLTVLYVTHDQVEALSLADRIAVMRSGVIIQEGAPADIYLSPQAPFVAAFVGKANQIKGVISEVDRTTKTCTVKTGVGQFRGVCSTERVFDKGDEVVFLIRPNIIAVSERENETSINTLEADIKVITFTGAQTECIMVCRGVQLEVQVPGLVRLTMGQRVYLHFDPQVCQILPVTE
jgi:iron(III) transport system ATP-binding protein